MSYSVLSKVRRYGMYEMVALSAQSPSIVGVFLSALKRFYSSVLFAGEYPYAHPLTNPVVHLLQEVDQEDTNRRRSRPKMPPESGVEEPEPKRPSDNYFRLVDKKWIPEPIDDSALHLRLAAGFKQARMSRRDQIVIRMAYESGARITELLTLTVGDWRKRGAEREAIACNNRAYQISLSPTSPPSAYTARPPPHDWPQSAHFPPDRQLSAPISVRKECILSSTTR